MSSISRIAYTLIQKKPSASLVIVSETSTIIETAIFLGKLYLCIENREHACSKCKNCLLVEKNEHPDFKHLDPSSLKDESIKIIDINSLESFFKLTSNQGGIRVFSLGFIEDVNSTIQNSLLKLLEEPPKNLKLILFTRSLDAVPLTIKSRCQTVDLRQDIKKEAEISAHKYKELDEKLIPLLLKCEKITPTDAARVCQNYELTDIIDRIIFWVHDIMLVDAKHPPLVFKLYEAQCFDVMKRVKSKQRLLESSYNILDMKRYLLNNLNKLLFLENVFMELKNGFK